MTVEFFTKIRCLRDALRRLAVAACCLALFLASAISAEADELLVGAESPDFQSALDRWLQNDEEYALSAFAALAGDGNKAAQLLLGRIDKTPAHQGPWLAHLPRADRLALLRQPGGLSGRSWLRALDDHPLGKAWLSLVTPSAGPELIATFAELNEPRAAREAMVILAAREHSGLREIDPAEIDPELIYLLWRSADDARRAELLDHVAADSPQRAFLDSTLDRAQLEDWLAGSAIGAPIDAVCAKYCTDSRAACLSAGYLALASHNALLTLGSPVEALVSQDRFLNTPRGRSSVLRRMLQTHDARGRRAMISQMRDHDACLADVLEAEAALYRYRRPGSDSSNGG